MAKNTALNNEGLPSLTTEQAAALLEIPPHRLRSEAKERGCCQRGKWLVRQAAEKRNCWYPYKAQMPRH